MWKKARKFAISLIKLAVTSNWEENEIGNLIALLSCHMEFNSRHLVKFLSKCDDAITPSLLSHLKDCDISFSAGEILEILDAVSENFVFLASNICNAAELCLLRLDDLETVEMVRKLIYAILPFFFYQCIFTQVKQSVVNSLTSMEFIRFTEILCENLISKKHCGKLLNNFTSHMLEKEAINIILHIMKKEYFNDLEGCNESFLNELPELRDAIWSEFSHGLKITDDFEVLDSDEDENGNLK